ncbi:MAG TPA: hypothetical protein VKG82_05000 [Solirubrobacteraceae bacterium]|nr:hypothetical protein [Solirubrobacteraceae bacterium]
MIGVYEPAILVRDGQAHSTSRAVAPQEIASHEHVYHRACYLRAHGLSAAD